MRWVIPTILLVFLAGAYGFRWDNGEQISKNGVKTTYYHDRWTGQTWTKAYGPGGYQDVPYFDQDLDVNQINRAKIRVYTKKPELQIRLSEADDKLASLSTSNIDPSLIQAHNQYSELYSMFSNQFELKYPIELENSNSPFSYSVYEERKAQWYRRIGEKTEYIDANMPADIAAKEKAYQENVKYINAQIYQLVNEKNVIYDSVAAEAKKDLETTASTYRLGGTILWGFLMLVALLWLLSYFWRDNRYREYKQIPEDSEIKDTRKMVPTEDIRNKTEIISHSEAPVPNFFVENRISCPMDHNAFEASTDGFSVKQALKFGWHQMNEHKVFSLMLLLNVLLGLALSPITPDMFINPLPGSFYGHLGIYTIVGLFIYAALWKGALLLVDNVAPQFNNIISFQTVINLFLFMVVYMVIVGIGFILLIVPGIIWSARLIPGQILIIDQNVGPIEALKRSWAMTKGYTIRILSIGFVYFLAMQITSYVIYAFGTVSVQGIFSIAGLSVVLSVVLFSLIYISRKLNAQAVAPSGA